MSRGKYTEALALFDQTLKDAPDNAYAWNCSSAILVDMKRPQEALDAAERAIMLKPTPASPYNNKAAALNLLKRFEEALPTVERAVERDLTIVSPIGIKGQRSWVWSAMPRRWLPMSKPAC